MHISLGAPSWARDECEKSAVGAAMLQVRNTAARFPVTPR